MCPDPRSLMCGSTAIVVRTAPSRLVCSIHFQSLVLIRSTGPSRRTPAMLRRMSTWPIALIASAAIDRTEVSLRTSVKIAIESAMPSWRISSTVRSIRSASKSGTTTRAPCRARARAAIRPIPLAPPATIATLPDRAPRGCDNSLDTAGNSIEAAERFGGLEAVQDRDPRREDVVELDQDDQRDAHPGRKDQGEGGRAGVERLGDQDAPPHEVRHVAPVLRLEQVGPKAVLEARPQRRPEQDDVQPVFDQRHLEPIEMSQQQGGERHHGHGEKKYEMDPDVVAIAARKVAQLR